MAFGSKETVENVGKKGTPKKIQPGTHKCRVLAIDIHKANYGKNAYTGIDRGDIIYLNLHLETVSPGKDFQGFQIDKDDKAKGFYTGQIGKVSTSSFGFDDLRKNKKTNTLIAKEDSVAQYLHALCLEANGSLWVENNMGVHPTFEAFIEAFNKDLPIKDVYLNFVIGGKRYTDDKGFFQHNLSLASLDKNAAMAGLKNYTNDKNVDNLYPFDYKELVYIKAGEEDEGTEEVSKFGNEPATPIVEVEDGPDFTQVADDPFDTEDKVEAPVESVENEDPFASDDDDEDDPFAV